MLRDCAPRQRSVKLESHLVPVTPPLILEAIDLHRLAQVSFSDALMLRAAKAGGCAEVLSDDLNHGQLYDGVRVVNPFRD
jgi:predicted nucleic acid-binding protein